MEWPKPSSARSSVTMSASVRVRMQTPSCSSYQFGSLTTTRFTRTRHSDIVHPVSSSQLTEARDRVRSFGGYNTVRFAPKATELLRCRKKSLCADSWNAAKLFARDHLRKNRCTTPKAGLESVAEVVDIYQQATRRQR